MSEVKRWKLKGFIPGIDGESKAVFQPTVVLADDYDAALAREATLREELNQCGSMAAMIEQKEWAEHAGSGPVSSRVESAFTQLHNELAEAQQRLTVAEQWAGVLKALLPNAELALKALNVAVSVYDVELADNARRGLRELIAALKPAEGEGS